MLIINRAIFRTNRKFLRVWYNKNILPFGLTLYTTYLLQMLNVVSFQLLEHKYSEATDEAIPDGNYRFLKAEFLAEITSICS